MDALDPKPLHRQRPHIRGVLPGPSSSSWLARDEAVMSPSYTRTYPLVVKRGSGAMIEDLDGNVFLDMTAGIAVTAVGHCHPKVTAAIRKQAGELVHMSGTDFYYRPQIELAEKLAALAPGDAPKRVFFTNSGTESNEAALKLARYATKRPRIIAFMGSFHGRTYGSMSLSGSKTIHRRGFSPMVPDIFHAHYGDLDSVRKLLKTLCPPEDLAAIFVEPIQGEGGYIVPPDDFLPGIRSICDEHGALMVVDEVQSGFGRTGKLFACEHWGIAPDILSLAKGIANGLPLGAIVARKDVMIWPPGSHASTFGGNPVSCAAALASLELIQNRYQENAAVIGEYLMAGLRDLMPQYPFLYQVRGKGLMVGMEVRPHGHPDGHFRDLIIDQAFQHGLLLLPCGPSTIRFCPPLCLTRRQVRIGLTLLDQALQDIVRDKPTLPLPNGGHASPHPEGRSPGARKDPIIPSNVGPHAPTPPSPHVRLGEDVSTKH